MCFGVSVCVCVCVCVCVWVCHQQSEYCGNKRLKAAMLCSWRQKEILTISEHFWWLPPPYAASKRHTRMDSYLDNWTHTWGQFI